MPSSTQAHQTRGVSAASSGASRLTTLAAILGSALAILHRGAGAAGVFWRIFTGSRPSPGPQAFTGSRPAPGFVAFTDTTHSTDTQDTGE
jgi:hypothetical protein